MLVRLAIPVAALWVVTGCASDPTRALRAEARQITGVPVAHCGGPHFRDESASLDSDCVQTHIASGDPFQYWLADVPVTLEGDPIFQGRLEFLDSNDLHFWQIEDHRADAFGDGVFVTRCVLPDGPVDAECDPTECIADCRGNP